MYGSTSVIAMANLFQLQEGTKSFGSRVLFQDASFSINEGEHVGVIGPNGAGKSTLFKILIGEEEMDSGRVTKMIGLRIGYLAQNDDWGAEDLVEDYIARDARMALWDLKSLGRSLGLSHEIFQKPILSLSGGYRMRCKLLRLLGEEPDILLLDEPTNYLDLESLLALETFLQGYTRSFLLISHDREFLRRTTDHIVEVESGEITKYNGSLDDYFEQKEMLRSQLEARAYSLSEKRKAVLDFVARFGAKATKAKQAQSRLKSLDRMEKIELKALPVTATIKLPPPISTGKQVLGLSGADLGYGDKTILRNVRLTLLRGDHMAVVGVNGAGKSTLLKALAKRIAPLKGETQYGYEVFSAYFAQHVSEGLNQNHTVLEAMGMKAHPSVVHQTVLNMAGSLLFSGEDVKKKISVLSGGEKSRVALGQILLERAPFLILDEPTNHLDFQTVEAFTQALIAYEGTLIVVSHDRSFVQRVATKILEIREGQAESFPGSYDDYVWSCQKGVLSERDGTPTAMSGSAKSGSGGAGKFSTNSETSRKFERPKTSEPIQDTEKLNYKDLKKQLERDLRKTEKDLKDSESQIAKFQTQVQLLNQKLIDHPGDANTWQWIQEISVAAQETSKLEESWLSLSEKLEALSSQLKELKGET